MTLARLRLVFCALALVLALPAGLLVRRALASVALEREARERAVAERVFDEMERVLTELLRREESRPAADYDFARADSPLRARPAETAALGWFEIEANGRVTTPGWAVDVAALAEALAADGARMEPIGTPQLATEAPKLEGRALTREKRAAAAEPETAKASPAPASAKDSQPPIASSPADDFRAAGGRELEEVDRTAAPPSEARVPSDEATSAYDALAKLNIGAKEREERRQRVYVEEQAVAGEGGIAPEPASAGRGSRPAPQLRDLEPGIASPAELEPERKRAQAIVDRALRAEPRELEDASATGSLGALPAPPAGEPSALAARLATGEQSGPGAATAASAERDDARAGKLDAPAQPQPSPAQERAAAPSARAEPDTPLLAQPPPAPPRTELVRVVVDPMRGRLAPGGQLLLVRSAWIGDRGVRQGVVLDVAVLARQLSAATLGSAALRDAQVELAAVREPAAPGPDDGRLRRFSHRFAEPFDALAAQLTFAPFLEDGARSVYWLAALFALAGTGGLLAIYRMTAVVLHFAERRSNFAAAVSHELKTPLTAIRLYAEMLRDGLVAGEEKRREYYGSITAETERLSRLINNVLEFSRLERGARSLELRVGDATEVVREAVDLLQSHARAHGVALALAVDDALPPVRFERDALTQIVFNLVDNAIKYGRGASARVEISCQRAGDGVAISVRDHGAGVPREELARILEPFYRRGDELTRSAQGAGIGLALVKSLVLQMGGALRLANAEGGGLVARVELRGPAPA